MRRRPLSSPFWASRAKWEARRDPQLEHAGNALLGRDDITDRVAEITCPALIVHGEADQAITMDRAEAVQAAIPDGRGLITAGRAAEEILWRSSSSATTTPRSWTW